MAAIHRVTALDLVVDDWHWPFADQRREDIANHFARQHAANPALWNGRVLLARDPHFHSDTFSACFFETDFASFLAWRDWGFPDTAIFNGFGMGALRGSDGGFVMGEMAAHTSNAGKIYFPSGTPDLNDINNGRVDIAASVAREVAEETGLTSNDYTTGNIWHCVPEGDALIALIRILDAPCPVDTLHRRIDDNLKKQTAPELCAAHIVRGVADVTPVMPGFIATFIRAQADDAA